MENDMMERMDIINFYHILGNKHPQTSCGWISLDWFKGNFTGKPIKFDGKNLGFRSKKYRLNRNQSNDGIVLMDKRQYQ